MNAVRPKQPLILASGSPRRSELLRLLLDSFEIVPADIDESQQIDETPLDYVRRMAQEKAAAVVARTVPATAPFVVLGADTVVVLGTECLGKPASEADAIAMLERLSNRSHHVLSAVALMDHSGACATQVSDSKVKFAQLPPAWIKRYVASGEPMDKAGAYGIQGAAAAWIHRIEGSYTGVMGLPLFETARLLRQQGLTE